MGLSWHDKEYSKMVDEMTEYLEEEYGDTLDKGNIHGIVGRFVVIMIGHGAVDPT